MLVQRRWSWRPSQALQGGNTLTEESVIATRQALPRAPGHRPPAWTARPLAIRGRDSIDLHLSRALRPPSRPARRVHHALRLLHRALPGRRRGGELRRIESAAVMTDLLRGELGYTRHHPDRLGPELCRSCQRAARTSWAARACVPPVQAGGRRGPRSSLTDACRRILVAKFQLGIFENPYVDPRRGCRGCAGQRGAPRDRPRCCRRGP